jgi:hypothetical protein
MSDEQDDLNARRAGYLAKAGEARHQAGRASDRSARGHWENVASGWEYLARHTLPDPGSG